MASKNLIIGGFTNYNYINLKPWVESALSVNNSEHPFEIVMVAGNTTKETVDTLTEKGIKVVGMEAPPNLPPHLPRWIAVYDFLKNHGHEYKNVVMTDLRDVYFQTNPFEWLDKNLGDKKIVAVSESLIYKNESWGNQNLMDTFGPYVYERFKDNEIYCVGVLAGKPDYLADLFLHNYLLALREPRALDQGTFNLLMQTQPYKDVVLYSKQKEGFACHAGTTADPRKMDNFRPNLLEPEPTFKDGIVYSSSGEPFCIVHQYDRVPEWKENINKLYNLPTEEEYFIYRT